MSGDNPTLTQAETGSGSENVATSAVLNESGIGISLIGSKTYSGPVVTSTDLKQPASPSAYHTTMAAGAHSTLVTAIGSSSSKSTGNSLPGPVYTDVSSTQNVQTDLLEFITLALGSLLL
ncbi:hypothetical protein N7490_006213 [Penicillium lividum]|nr:hypothetical protein N7490_006213 [Penicillium lividum]